MADKKPRILQSNKDMFWSLVPLLVGCLIIAAIAGQCSIHVGGPEAGEIPRIDAAASLRVDAQTLDFPIREPRVPEQWTPNSASRKPVTGGDGAQASTIGFVTDTGTFLGLTQSDADERSLVTFVAEGDRTPTGAEQIADTTWVTYEEDGAEKVWIADFGDVRVLITGSGSTDEFVTLATAVVQAPVLE